MLHEHCSSLPQMNFEYSLHMQAGKYSFNLPQKNAKKMRNFPTLKMFNV